jgi:histidinol-phosphate aminotransferase
VNKLGKTDEILNYAVGSKRMTARIRQQRGLDAITPYVSGKPIEELQKEHAWQEVIELSLNENPLGTSPRALAAIEKALSRLNRYPDGSDYYLRHALADRLEVEPEQLIVGNGADGIILATCMAYVDEDSEVIVSRSSFVVYDMFTHAMRAALIKTPLKDYGLDLDAMAGAINDRTRLIFVCNPNNPTGTIVTADEVDAFMGKVPDHVLVVFDEAYYELVASDDYPDVLKYIRQGQSNVLIMRTFSKVYGMAGIRLGYGIAVSESLAPLNRVKEPFSVNLLAQAAGIAALEDEAFLKKSVAANHEGRLFLYREFERLGLLCIKSHTNFVLVEIGPRAVAIQQRLFEKGVIVRPCAGYDLPNCLRITVGTPAQNARLIEVLEDIL